MLDEFSDHLLKHARHFTARGSHSSLWPKPKTFLSHKAAYSRPQGLIGHKSWLTLRELVTLYMICSVVNEIIHNNHVFQINTQTNADKNNSFNNIVVLM